MKQNTLKKDMCDVRINMCVPGYIENIGYHRSFNTNHCHPRFKQLWISRFKWPTQSTHTRLVAKWTIIFGEFE